MRVILFGATGMVGQGVLRECLLDSDVVSVLTIGRSATGRQDAKLREIVHKDFSDFSTIAEELVGLRRVLFLFGRIGDGNDGKRIRTCYVWLRRGSGRNAGEAESGNDVRIYLWSGDG